MIEHVERTSLFCVEVGSVPSSTSGARRRKGRTGYMAGHTWARTKTRRRVSQVRESQADPSFLQVRKSLPKRASNNPRHDFSVGYMKRLHRRIVIAPSFLEDRLQTARVYGTTSQHSSRSAHAKGYASGSPNIVVSIRAKCMYACGCCQCTIVFLSSSSRISSLAASPDLVHSARPRSKLRASTLATRFAPFNLVPMARTL